MEKGRKDGRGEKMGGKGEKMGKMRQKVRKYWRTGENMEEMRK